MNKCFLNETIISQSIFNDKNAFTCHANDRNSLKGIPDTLLLSEVTTSIYRRLVNIEIVMISSYNVSLFCFN